MLSQCASHEGKEKMCLEAKKSAPNCCCHNFTLWISNKNWLDFVLTTLLTTWFFVSRGNLVSSAPLDHLDTTDKR